MFSFWSLLMNLNCNKKICLRLCFACGLCTRLVHSRFLTKKRFRQAIILVSLMAVRREYLIDGIYTDIHTDIDICTEYSIPNLLHTIVDLLIVDPISIFGFFLVFAVCTFCPAKFSSWVISQPISKMLKRRPHLSPELRARREMMIVDPSQTNG